MYTDMVGYTALGQRNEQLSLALVDEQRKLIRPVLAKHNGREVKTMGDAFLVEFSNTLDAVRCAYDIQRTTREFNISLPEEQRIHLRVGIHLGDVVESVGDISGDAVNVASRIVPLAEDGGVSLTRQVYDQVQNKFDLPLTSLGSKKLKNVAAPAELFKMVMPWSEKKASSQVQLERNKVAVLPFANMSPDPGDEYFADGMTEELIAALSKLRGVGVISRTSVMQYKNQTKNVGDIGRELGAGTLLEGSVRKAGNRVRIAVQLIDASTDNHLWAENYDRNLDDIFAIQSDVASKVSASLKAGVFVSPSDADTDNVEAYTIYIRAMQLSHESSEQNLRNAIRLLEDAIMRDPSFARAHVGLAHVWVRMGNYGYENFTTTLNNAVAEAQKALELQPSSAEAHAALAEAFQYQDRFVESASEAEIAIRSNPNIAEAHSALGLTYSTEGRLEKGLVHLRKALELDPLSVYHARTMALVMGVAGRADEANALMSRMQQLFPDNFLVYLGLADSYMFARDFVTAQKMLDKGLEIGPDEPLLLIDQGLLYAFTGRNEEAEEVLRRIQRNKSESVRLFSQQFIQAALGNTEEAIQALMRGPETHAWPFLIKTLPVFEELRKDPRFKEFSLKMGIPA